MHLAGDIDLTTKGKRPEKDFTLNQNACRRGIEPAKEIGE
jgi:hypothetical protein